MKTALIALAVFALLATSTVYVFHHQNSFEEAELEHHVHLPKLHIKIDWNNLGGCASALQSACSTCKAAYDQKGKSVSGDINCVKNILSAKSCKHIF